MNPLKYLLGLLQTEPAVFTSFLAAAAVLVSAFAVHVTMTQEAAIVTIGTGIITVITAALARPVNVALLVGAVLTGLTAAAAFGLHLTPDVLGAISTILTLGITTALRMHLTPVVTLKKAASAYKTGTLGDNFAAETLKHYTHE